MVPVCLHLPAMPHHARSVAQCTCKHALLEQEQPGTHSLSNVGCQARFSKISSATKGISGLVSLRALQAKQHGTTFPRRKCATSRSWVRLQQTKGVRQWPLRRLHARVHMRDRRTAAECEGPRTSSRSMRAPACSRSSSSGCPRCSSATDTRRRRGRPSHRATWQRHAGMPRCGGRMRCRPRRVASAGAGLRR